MVWLWNKKQKQDEPVIKSKAKKPRRKTFILEEIVTPSGVVCPAPIDDSLVHHDLFGLFTEEELKDVVLGITPTPDITDIDIDIELDTDTKNIIDDFSKKLADYLAGNPDIDVFNPEDLSNLPTLDNLINPGKPTIEIPDVGGAVDTLPPPVILPVDPPRNDPNTGNNPGQNLDDVSKIPLLKNPIPDITLGVESSAKKIDISEVFTTQDGGKLTYKIISKNSPFLNVSLDDTYLYIEALPKTGKTQVTIQATSEAGKTATHTFNVFNNYITPESLATINTGLTELQNVIDANSGDLLAALNSDETEAPLDTLMETLEQNPELIQLLATPETLAGLGIDNSSVATLQQLLQSQEFANEFGLNVPLGEALSNPDSTVLDNFLLNADEATSLLPDNAKQPKVGFIDFSQGNHIQQVRNTFASVNPLAKYDSFNVKGGDWASELVKFVDKVKRAGENHAIANLSFDLSQLDDIGTTTRYEMTPAEKQAIQYARDNNVLLVVASGNTGGVMSALGQASKEFENIITVGAVTQFESKADYSGYGNGLTLMAPGGSWQDDPKAFVGTSRATAYVSAAASLVWSANPELSFLQVKQLLIDTAADLDIPGWDELTGAGLIDIKEAIARAPFVEPEKLGFSEKPDSWESFSGEGRVKTLARPTSENTLKAIAELQNTQETLLEQWEVLADLGNPLLDLPDLESELEGKIAEALEKYQQVSTDAAISTAQTQQWVEALALATQHYQIEQARLQELLGRQKELEENLAGLGQQKTALEAETQQLLDGIKEQIAKAESDLAAAEAKLSNPFANADDNLQTDPQPWRDAAAAQEQKATTFRQQAADLAAESIRYQSIAKSINPTQWQVVRSESRPSGRSREIWGWGQNPQLVKQKNRYLWLAGITAQNSQMLQQLAGQTDQQAAALNQYGQFLEDRNNSLNLGSGSTDDAATVLQLLQDQVAKQQALADKYFEQANIAEQRRQQSQNNANYHNSLINRWEVVGTRRTGKSGRNVENVYGWRHYPEHIAPRDRSQQLANEANAERQIYAQLAQQAQQQANVLAEQGRKLQERLRDWSVLKQGIEYEIAADGLRLQAEKDLLAMHEPVQEQKLETLNLYISQAQAELEKLTAQKLPTQQELTDATEERLLATQSEVEAIHSARSAAQKDLQNFLETAGFLLPYRERLAAVEKTIQQLSDDKLRVEETIQQLAVALLETPSDTLSQQLDRWQNYLETITLELDWGNLQKDQLAMAVADSPERLAISSLIQDLQASQATTIANNIPVEKYIDFLRGVEGSGGNFLEGFDNLEQRLAAAETEKVKAQESLGELYDEYRDLGLEKSKLEDNLIPAKENEIGAKELEILGSEEAIAQTYDSLNSLKNQLTQTENAQTVKADEIQQQEQAIAQTQTQLTDTQNQITAKDAEIQKQESIALDYQNQINQAKAAANSWEQQRQAHQNAANYWNSQIGVFNEAAYLAYNPDVARAVAERWWGKNSSGWYHYMIYGRFEGRYPNPQAAANRNAHQAAANNATVQRDVANQKAQQLNASLQPQIAITQEQINTLDQEKQPLIQQQQALQNQLTDQQTTQQQLQQELETIVQEFNVLEANIQQQQQKLEGLNNQLQQQEQQLDTLNGELNNLNEQASLLEQQLIDKYRQIEITDKYLSQVEGEINRLDSRIELLNRSVIIEKQYQDNWQQWQEANQTRTDATEALIATRQAGASDRSTLASLQSQLSKTQANLDQAKTIQQSIADTKQAVEFSKLQLGNQKLLEQSLIDRDAPLAAAEQYYLNLAEASQQGIWSGNGYNAGEASAYRTYLQQASFIADQRNQAWQQLEQTQAKIGEINQQITQQQTQIDSQPQELENLEDIAQLEAQIASINSDINTVNQRLEPLETQENQQTQAIATADAQMQNLATELVQTAQLQGDALRQLVGFGILASESDVDFFLTQVEPNVKSAIEQLREREPELTTQLENAKVRTANAEQQLANTTDDVSKQALTNLIEQLQQQQTNLEALKAQNQNAADELEDLLNQANAALTPLRQKQEVEIRQKLDSNYDRLQALESQLNSEKAAETAQETNTVLAYAQLTDQIRQDLTENAKAWTQQLLAGHQLTKELGNSQQNLSHSVDELITYINDKFADPHREYNQSEADLRDGIITLGVVENRADELDSSVTSVEDAIEQIKLRIEQDATLWSEIAPIAIRYGVESKALEDYQQQSNLLKEAQKIIEPFFNLEKQKADRLKLSDGYQYFENPTNGNRYFLTNAVTTWHGAQSEAKRVGGNLVTIRNQAEQEWLASRVKTSAWMGLHDTVREGRWQWISGEPVTYTNFSPGQPDNAGGLEDWTEFLGQASGKWNDVQSWNGVFQNSKPGLVEVSVKDIEQQQQPVIQNLLNWAKQNNAIDKIPEIARQILDQSPDNVKYGKELEGLRYHLAEFERLTNQGDKDQAAKHLTFIVDNAQTLLRPAFLHSNLNNGTAIDWLQAVTLEGSNPTEEITKQLNATQADVLLNAEAVEGRNPLQALFDKSKAAQASHEAQGHALLAQAAWYEQQAAYHWNVSRKNGPYWYEQREVRGKSGKKHTETITHVDHHWIVWQQYSQLFPKLRKQGIAHLAEADKWRKEKERLELLKNQWVEANDAANEANPVVTEARNLFAELEAARSDIPQAQTQLELLETLLPTLQQQLEEAEAEAKAQNAKVQQQWEEYDTDSEEYRAAVADILERRGELNKQAIETQQQIAESELWVERQSVALSDELAAVQQLTTNLQKQQQENEQKINELVAQGVTTGLDDLKTKNAQIEQSLQMLTNKAAVLTAEQTALTQKRTLLTAQNEVILAEQRLLDAYINDPDGDTSNLQKQLLDAREALAEAQRLAEQAEKASQALTAPLQQLKTDLLAQNDEHLQAAKEHQQILRALVEATQSNANYTLQAAQKQQQVNDLEFQILQHLQTATAEGYKEAKHLLDVAKYNDIATAAEIYYRDYSDLASDKGSSSAGGLARPEDRILADNYYREMLNNRELQRRAQSQADDFRVAKETAQAHIKTLQTQQETAQELLNAINAKVAETQEERDQKQQELAVAQARLDGITRIREQTEQTFIHLVTIEKLNLAQAQLEQEIAQNREAEIDEAVQARQERDRLELERKRLETQARIEQLRQLQVEDDFRQSLNNVLGELGLETLEATENPVQLQTQLAGLLTNLQDLENEQPDLPDNVKALLAEARGDIHLALQGKEAKNIQENLLSAMDGLIGQIESYKTEINRIDLEEEWDNQLLQQAQSDLQGASQQLLKELERSAALSGEHDVIDPLYMEVLNKVALAEQAVDISEDMAQQSKGMLEQIIKQRVAERKARKKAFWNKILGIVSQVIGILGTILSFTPLAPLGIALNFVSAGIGAIQMLINGDWMGALTQVLFGGFGSSVYQGVRSIMSGQGLMGGLQILSGFASVFTAGLGNFVNQASLTLQQVLFQVVKSLQTVPLLIYNSIESIKNGDFFAAISNIFNTVITLGTNFGGVFSDTAGKVFEYIGKIGNTGLAIGGAIKEGSLEGWLSGINSIIGMWGPDIANLVDRLKGEPIDPTLPGYGDDQTFSC